MGFRHPIVQARADASNDRGRVCPDNRTTGADSLSERRSDAGQPPVEQPDAERPDAGKITELLGAAAGGDRGAFEAVIERVYPELQRVAEGRLIGRYGARHRALTLEPAALVNETLLKLIEAPHDFENRRHFYSFATKVMLRVLLDYERRRRASKRGGDQIRVTLADFGMSDDDGQGILELNQALERLEELDARKTEVVKLRVFWGLEMSEIGSMLGISVATVERDWRFSRRWLRSELRP